MKKNKSRKSYMIYASDYHFEMIGLLNIRKELKENKTVIILTQNDLEKTVKTVLSRITMNEEEKEKIQKINWTGETETKYKEIKNSIEQNQEISIYIKGEEKFIEEQNKKINKLIESENNFDNISIVDCYDFSEISERSNEIIKKYDEVLVTGNKISINSTK